MVRLIAPDYLSVKEGSNEKPQRKEFLYYQESWEGKDFLGRQLNPVSEHFEGRYDKQFTKPHINEQTGEIDYMELDPTKAQTIYYIPYSKKAVDDIIKSQYIQTKIQLYLRLGLAVKIIQRVKDRCQQGTNFLMSNLSGHGRTSISTTLSQLFKRIWNGLIVKNQKMDCPLNLLNLISIKIIREGSVS